MALSLNGGAQVGIVDLATGSRVRVLPDDADIGGGFGFTADGRFLASTDGHGGVRLWSRDWS